MAALRPVPYYDYMGQEDEPAQPQKPLGGNDADTAGFKVTRRVIALVVLLVAVIAAVVAVAVACSPMGGGGGTELPGGY